MPQTQIDRRTADVFRADSHVRRRGGPSDSHRCQRALPAFSLIELLVVIGIIALLIGILMPMLARAQQESRNTKCKAMLRDIGMRFSVYLNETRNSDPFVDVLPSLLGTVPPEASWPSMTQLLAPYSPASNESYHCPADRFINASDYAGLITADSWYGMETTSYYWKLPPPAPPRIWQTVYDALVVPPGLTSADIVVAQDYEAFHDRSGTNDAQNCLFLDGHVADFSTTK